MRQLVVKEWMSLDGVFDAETMGEWWQPFDSAQRQRSILEQYERGDAYLLGRTTYELLWPFWSTQTDGICLDADGALWYADVGNKRCVRLREGGEVLHTIELDRGCFACMLGGADGKTFFIVATEWKGAEQMADGSRTGQVLTVQAPAAHAGWP